ncbi:Holliday junction branch migration protein RuvA [Derxia gummosa]|uniref:Holliday junction branch migration complex subunit RuvA n=1 Tax=Derxia gummosa DSM 723 TaxID=1121388 RepID=A0A8B6X5C8_9BURK|nr:Holliday junction branch migration protein RuvA [Derxia gummosa]
MIGKLTGRLLEKTPPTVLIDVHGVGYEVDVPMSTLYALPPLGEPVSLRTHFVVREDAQLLYGFATEAERAAFRQLLKISGVGARIALAVLSGLSVEELASAVAMQEQARLVRIPGIGKKTAERLLLELKGKIGAPVGGMPGIVGSGDLAPATETDAQQNDVLNALVALGYSDREAAAVIKKLPPGSSVEDGIRAALRLLARG